MHACSAEGCDSGLLASDVCEVSGEVCKRGVGGAFGGGVRGGMGGAGV